MRQRVLLFLKLLVFFRAAGFCKVIKVFRGYPYDSRVYVSRRAFEEYQVETVYESVADLHFTHMVDALIKDKKGDCLPS